MEDDFEPDIVDLQTWMCTCTDKFVSKMWEITKYWSAPYKIWLSVWREVGKPDIEMLAVNGKQEYGDDESHASLEDKDGKDNGT